MAEWVLRVAFICYLCRGLSDMGTGAAASHVLRRKTTCVRQKADPSTPRTDLSLMRAYRVAEYDTVREGTGKLLGMASTAMLRLTRLSFLALNNGCGGLDSNTAEPNYGHHMELEENCST